MNSPSQENPRLENGVTQGEGFHEAALKQLGHAVHN